MAEDLSVIGRSTGGTTFQRAARQVQAETYSSDIRQRAAQLVGLDQEVAGRISTALAAIASISFDDLPALEGPAPTRHWGVQLVDWKQSPEPTPGPTAQDIRDAIKDLPQGTRPDFLEVRNEEQLRQFWEWISRNASDYTPSNPYRGGKGILRQLPDGTTVGLGESNKWSTTLDVSLPDGAKFRLHVNAARGGELNIPKPLGEPVPARGATPDAPPQAPVERPPVKAPMRPPPPAIVKPPPAVLAPVPPESIPHPVHLPHTHHGPPVLGKDELPDLSEFEGD